MDNPDTLLVGILHCETDTKYKVKKPLSAVLDVISKKPELDILLGPEWFFIAEEKEFYTPQEFAFIQRRLEHVTEGLEMLLIPGSIARLDDKGHYKNTALVISDGKTLLKYSKRVDGGDKLFAEEKKLVWESGEKKGGFTWRDYEVGIEICADYGILKETDGKTELDFQIVVACGMSLDSYCSSVHDKGIVMLCDGDSLEHAIEYHLNPQQIYITPILEECPLSPQEDAIVLRTYRVPTPGSIVEPALLDRWLTR